MASLSLSMTMGIRTPPRTVQVIAFGYMEARSSWLNTRFVVALEYPRPIPFPWDFGAQIQYAHPLGIDTARCIGCTERTRNIRVHAITAEILANLVHNQYVTGIHQDSGHVGKCLFEKGAALSPLCPLPGPPLSYRSHQRHFLSSATANSTGAFSMMLLSKHRPHTLPCL